MKMIHRVTLNEDLAEIIACLSAQTGLSANDITKLLLKGHLSELHELNTILDMHPAGAGSIHEQAANLIQSYGPESIMDGIARIAPHWEMLAARFDREIKECTNQASTPLQ